MSVEEKFENSLKCLRENPDPGAIASFFNELAKDSGLSLESRIRVAFKSKDVGKLFLACLPSCASCTSLIKAGALASVREFEVLFDALSSESSKAVFARVPQPRWCQTAEDDIGAQMYFRCNYCHSIWCLTAPERVIKGSWRRVG